MGSEYSFFKKICSSEKMEIPLEFVWQMGGALDKRCILRDGDENEWPVEVATQGDKWWFRKGWAKLYREKSLNEGDILMFEYRGNNLFHFKLFGEGARESRVKEEELEFDEYEDEEKHEELEHSDENDDDDDDDDEEDDDDEYDDEEDDEDDDDDDDDDYVKEEEDDDSEYVRKDKQVHTSKKIKPGPQLKTTTIGAQTIPSRRRYKKNNVPDCYGDEIFKSGLASRPENPYFVSRTRTLARKNELYIPKDVIVDYHLNIPVKILIMDEHGRKWETKMKQWKDGRVWCTKGWKSLCRTNNIETDDICICEFVREQGCNKDMFIRVRVVSQDN
ncbi:hypothetical protein CASFOL_032927 [Castilleja foliolosa]|uniref:TF-B3 domain-containing protein n=1 Tax=Castilleja foliolosa TaxID=1961234 RepID=A0ABD3C2V7_9LAMI